ncbi:hypothetical protein FKR81_12440 [Lentzea tibetensis]|uniref:Calx-beta domain-containing protein n=1 Tax=Lentzea tibetensis TaxID=2591470 RepID=A0A563EVF1_9PSEU|nr:hypothetical protein [Lentzea tibetensis]TWP51680.1 hypothetical protein FKR81_12440 [Lentzea tibetensis]
MKLLVALLSLLVLPCTAQATPAGCGEQCELSVNDGPVCVVPNPCKVKFQLDEVTMRDITAEYRVDNGSARPGREFEADPTGRVVVRAGTDHAVLTIKTLAGGRDSKFDVVATRVSAGRIVKATGAVTIKSH